MNIKIKNIEYYHPKTSYSNEYFLKHFSDQDVDISGLLNVTGRNQRYVSEDFHENSLTMAIEACKKSNKDCKYRCTRYKFSCICIFYPRISISYKCC